MNLSKCSFYLLGFIAFVSCSKDNDAPRNEEYLNRSLHETTGSAYFFITDKDEVKWEAIHYGVEYNQETGKILLFADQFDEDLQTGNQIVLRFTSPQAFHFYGDYNLQAEYNSVIGGDSGVMPYEIDGAYVEQSFEISEIDAENQIIEGQFSIRLKRKSIFNNSGYGEYVYLTNGSFRLLYEIN